MPVTDAVDVVAVAVAVATILDDAGPRRHAGASRPQISSLLKTTASDAIHHVILCRPKSQRIELMDCAGSVMMRGYVTYQLESADDAVLVDGWIDRSKLAKISLGLVFAKHRFVSYCSSSRAR